jgi:hypothetical protein
LRTSTTDYLNRKRGTDCVLLAYVTGVTVAIPEDAPDYRLPTFDDEMILRAPYTVGNLFQQDNRLVWETLRMAFHGGCRGPGFILCSYGKWTCSPCCCEDSLPVRGLSVLNPRTFFDGKARTFTFEKYCERLNNAFTDLEESGETVDVE